METQATVTITPATLAKAFWSMADTEQAQFFSDLSQIIRKDHKAGNTSAYNQGECHWFFLAGLLSEAGQDDARSMLMTMAAPLYLHTLRAAGQH